ncbi:hypothetical protein ACVXHB_10680 [Escherichia coli]
MLLWLSEDYQKRYQVDDNCLQNRRKRNTIHKTIYSPRYWD